MPKPLELFLLAVAFLTRLPVPVNLDFSKTSQHQSQSYYPLVGLLLALLILPLLYSVSYIFGDDIAVVAALAVTVVLTGGLHEDGFADCCDGFGGGYGDKDKILLIMKDSVLGAFGVTGLILLLLFKFLLLRQVVSMPFGLLSLTLMSAYVMSRWQPLLVMRQLDYVLRSDSRVAEQTKRPAFASLLWSSLWGVSLLSLLAWGYAESLWQGAVIVVLPLLSMWLWSKICSGYFKRRLGGYTGDCLGASQQVAECIVYALAVCFIRQGWLS